MVYPWWEQQQEQLLALIAEDRFPHALLLNAARGLGSEPFVNWLINHMFCAQSDADRVCGECSDCRLLSAGTHPDLLEIEPEGGSRQIKVVQIRQAVDFLQKTAQQGGKKILIVMAADRMNVNAANALLKSLEEPAGETLIVLMSYDNGSILPTIRSRCAVIAVTSPPVEMSLAWLVGQGYSEQESRQALMVSNYRPILAHDLLNGGGLSLRFEWESDLLALFSGELSAFHIADKCQDDSDDWLEWVLIWLSCKAKENSLKNCDVQNAALITLYDRILSLQADLLAGANINRRLAMESILLNLPSSIADAQPS